MTKYRGFVGQVATLGCMGCGAQDCAGCPGLGFIRTEINGGGGAYAWRTPTTYVTNKISAPTVELEPAPVLEPVKSAGLIDPAQQEIEARQYAEGGDGTATEIERTAKIDEAFKRLMETYASTAGDKDRWAGITAMYHPDDINSTTPISCMRGNPNIQTLVAMVCKPNQAFIDWQKSQGLKTTFTPEGEKPAMPALLPLAIGAGLIWLMS